MNAPISPSTRVPMHPVQCRMARAALGWSTDELAAAANVCRKTVSRFENHGVGSDVLVAILRHVLEARGIRFRRAGERLGLLFPPSLAAPSIDEPSPADIPAQTRPEEGHRPFIAAPPLTPHRARVPGGKAELHREPAE